MKITANINIAVLEKEAKTIATTGKESYSLAILQGSEAGNISCVQDVFNIVKPLHTYTVTAVYDDKYQYMRITSVDVRTEKPLSAIK